MALTLRRWIMIALVGVALIPVVILRPVPTRAPSQESDRYRLLVSSARSQARVQRAADMLALLRLHDSVRAISARAMAPRVELDRAITEPARSRVASLLNDATTMMRPAQQRVPVDVFAVLDSAGTIRGHSRSGFGALTTDYLLPQPETNERCVVLARMNPTYRSYAIESTSARERLLGPCAFYEAFGHPGPQVKSWLDSRAWVFAQIGSLHTDAGWYATPDWRRARPDLRHVLSFTGFQCAAGNDGGCRSALFARGPFDERAVGPRGAILTPSLSYSMGGQLYMREGAFGPRQPVFLADMARALGPEKFVAFWQSRLAPEEAFRQATGEELTAWTRAWLHRTYRAQETGSRISVSTALLGLLLLGAGIGVATLAAQRRQVGT